jgi:hypothetical protein
MDPAIGLDLKTLIRTVPDFPRPGVIFLRHHDAAETPGCVARGRARLESLGFRVLALCQFPGH